MSSFKVWGYIVIVLVLLLGVLGAFGAFTYFMSVFAFSLHPALGWAAVCVFSIKWLVIFVVGFSTAISGKE